MAVSSAQSQAQDLRARGRYDEAIAVYRQAIVAGEKAYWRDIGDTLIAHAGSPPCPMTGRAASSVGSVSRCCIVFS